MNPEKKSLAVFAFVIVLTVTLGELKAQPGRGPASVAVGKVAQVRRAGLETFVGSLQPLRKSTVGSAVDGRVVSIDVERGDPVSADPTETGGPDDFVGQPVTQLRTGTLAIEIGSAEIQLKLAEQALNELEVTLPREIELAEAKAAEAEARLQYSKDSFDRSTRLGGKTGAISEGELELSRSQYLADQEAARAAKIGFERLKSTRKLRLLQLNLRIEAGKQELARLHDLKAKYTIRAPFEGLVTEKLTEVGEWVTKGQAIVEIVQLNPIEMIINTPQEHVSRIQTSLGAASETDPLVANIQIEGIEEPLIGIVKRIISKADLRSRTFPVRIEIENPALGSGYTLQPGMLGRASLMIGVEQEMMMVKKDALVLGGAQMTVFKIVRRGDDVVAIGVPVTMGASLGEWIQVTGDIGVEDEVVLLGNERLRSGQSVKVTRTIDDLPE